jgi:osmotically-inducible protein OsmY
LIGIDLVMSLPIERSANNLIHWIETLNGTVMLSGFAKNAKERSMAESLAREVRGVKAVKNEIAVPPVPI